MKRTQNDARANGQHYGMNWIRKDKRLAIYLRDGMACMYCGSSIEDGATLTLDHVTPHSHGGSNKDFNLVTCCHKCNSVRADRNVEEFCNATAGYLGHSISGFKILSAIAEHTSMDLAPFRAEAKAIIARRPTWQAALEAASK